MTHELQLRDAKATFSAVVDLALQGEPSVITRHGRREAVVLSYAEWQRLSNVPSFGSLLAAAPLTDAEFPSRSDDGLLARSQQRPALSLGHHHRRDLGRHRQAPPHRQHPPGRPAHRLARHGAPSLQPAHPTARHPSRPRPRRPDRPRPQRQRQPRPRRSLDRGNRDLPRLHDPDPQRAPLPGYPRRMPRPVRQPA